MAGGSGGRIKPRFERRRYRQRLPRQRVSGLAVSHVASGEDQATEESDDEYYEPPPITRQTLRGLHWNPFKRTWTAVTPHTNNAIPDIDFDWEYASAEEDMASRAMSGTSETEELQSETELETSPVDNIGQVENALNAMARAVEAVGAPAIRTAAPVMGNARTRVTAAANNVRGLATAGANQARTLAANATNNLTRTAQIGYHGAVIALAETGLRAVDTMESVSERVTTAREQRATRREQARRDREIRMQLEREHEEAAARLSRYEEPETETRAIMPRAVAPSPPPVQEPMNPTEEELMTYEEYEQLQAQQQTPTEQYTLTDTEPEARPEEFTEDPPAPWVPPVTTLRDNSLDRRRQEEARRKAEQDAIHQWHMQERDRLNRLEVLASNDRIREAHQIARAARERAETRMQQVARPTLNDRIQALADQRPAMMQLAGMFDNTREIVQAQTRDDLVRNDLLRNMTPEQRIQHWRRMMHAHDIEHEQWRDMHGKPS